MFKFEAVLKSRRKTDFQIVISRPRPEETEWEKTVWKDRIPAACVKDKCPDCFNHVED